MIRTKEGLVSIITPTYNSEKFISETIESIKAQSYTNWELLITDDCSTDNTIEVIQKFTKSDKRIKLFKLKENSGAGIARNTSIKNATGTFIAFCDSDDQWLPEKLATQISFMQKNDLRFTYSSYYTIDTNGNRKGIIAAPSKLTYSMLLRNNYVGCLTAIYNQEKLGKIYMSEIRKRQDWTLWLKIMGKLQYTCGIQEPLAIYRIRPNSVSSKKISLLQITYNLYRKELNMGMIKSIFYLFRYLFYLVKKKIS